MTAGATYSPGSGPDPRDWLSAHGDALFRYALLHTRDAATAEDAVQDTLLAAMRGATSFDGRSSERTWLIGILKHKLIDQQRRATRQVADDDSLRDEAVTSQFTAGGTWSAPPRRWSGDPAQSFAQREFWDVLMECLRGLPDRLAFAFCQREMEDAPSAEICKVLDVTPTNLWTLLHRARTRLRRCLEANWFRHEA